MRPIFGKQPAFWLGVIQAALAFVLTLHEVSSELGLTADTVGLIMAALFALVGVYEAFTVRDTMLAALTAAAKALLALFAAYRLQLTADQTAALLGLVAILGGIFVRDRTSPLAAPSFKSTEDSPVLTKGNLTQVA